MIPPPVRDPRYPSLDAWRGMACLMVVLHHAGYGLLMVGASKQPAGDWPRRLVAGFIRQMDLGVPLFFVISGYCIAASMDGHRRRGASSREFLARRFRRIYPPYWAALLFFLATTWGLDRLGLGWLHGAGHTLRLLSPGELDWHQWLGNVTLAETWRPRVWGEPEALLFTGVAWTLCYEEQFYFVCSAILLVAPRRLFEALAVATAAIVGDRLYWYDVRRLDLIDGTFFNLWHEFAVGLAVYWRLARATSIGERLAVSGTLVALMIVGIASESRETAVASGFGLALIALRRWDGWADRRPWMGTLRALGRRSYSIYLVHMPFCVVGHEWLYSLGIVGFWPRLLVIVPILLAVSVGAGWGFFALVESRSLSPPRARGPDERPVAGEATG
jgi:peptidoglycan/LPS O-acetylase OafA/YrhL